MVTVRSRKPGDIAGRIDPKGYRSIKIDGAEYRAHRLAWLYVYGEWPSNDIDHIDTDRANNAIENLRIATKSQNGSNRGPNTNNKSGFKGVSWDANAQRWRAQLRYRRVRFYLGSYQSPEDAHAAYVAKAVELFGEFARAA